jgi:putative ABC transport system ATP-binding protein/lipoprotein-releasing system ATP-binding protein
MNEAILTARGVRKTFMSGDRRLEVLAGVDLDVAAGESVSIRGESGSGKSTLLQLLAGLDAPDAGTLAWAGESDTGTARRGRFLGIVFQSFYLIPELNARENVLMARRILGPIDAAARKRADDLLAKVGLAERAKHLSSQLSGGERQRVAVARALLNSPRLILADEPTGNLDERTAANVFELMLELNRAEQTSLVLVTHDRGLARRLDRVLELHEGRLRELAITDV